METVLQKLTGLQYVKQGIIRKLVSTVSRVGQDSTRGLH